MQLPVTSHRDIDAVIFGLEDAGRSGETLSVVTRVVTGPGNLSSWHRRLGPRPQGIGRTSSRPASPRVRSWTQRRFEPTADEL